jgi:hypothetical protein
MRADGSNQAARATFERHRSDLGYGLLLTPYAKEIGKADEGAIAKAVEDSIPQVAPLFWSFRLMVGIGVALLALFAAAFLQLCRGRLVQSPRLLRALLWSIPLPWIAIEAGWFVAVEDKVCKKFSAERSAVSSARAGPSSVHGSVSANTISPSCTRHTTWQRGST